MITATKHTFTSHLSPFSQQLYQMIHFLSQQQAFTNWIDKVILILDERLYPVKERCCTSLDSYGSNQQPFLVHRLLVNNRTTASSVTSISHSCNWSSLVLCDELITLPINNEKPALVMSPSINEESRTRRSSFKRLWNQFPILTIQ